MKYFEVGQTVYCAIFGKMEVIEINDVVRCRYIDRKSAKSSESYTLDGRYYADAKIVLSQKPIPTIVNVPIFEERPAYFCDSNGLWLYDILVGVNENRKGKANSTGYWYSKWQYEAPAL